MAQDQLDVLDLLMASLDRSKSALVSGLVSGGGNVSVADLDDDGDLDVVAGSMDDRIVWWEQNLDSQPNVAHDVAQAAWLEENQAVLGN